jgi:hypothetical protein
VQKIYSGMERRESLSKYTHTNFPCRAHDSYLTMQKFSGDPVCDL